MVAKYSLCNESANIRSRTVASLKLSKDAEVFSRYTANNEISEHIKT